MPHTLEAEVVVSAAAASINDQYDRAMLVTNPAERETAMQAAEKSEQGLRRMALALRRQPGTKGLDPYEPVVITGEKLRSVLGGLALVMGTTDDTAHRAEDLWSRAHGVTAKPSTGTSKADAQEAELLRLKRGLNIT